MKKNYENLPYEFLLLINNKPIVGRNFQVKGFNSSSLKSMELKETIDDVVDTIIYSSSLHSPQSKSENSSHDFHTPSP